MIKKVNSPEINMQMSFIISKYLLYYQNDDSIAIYWYLLKANTISDDLIFILYYLLNYLRNLRYLVRFGLVWVNQYFWFSLLIIYNLLEKPIVALSQHSL